MKGYSTQTPIKVVSKAKEKSGVLIDLNNAKSECFFKLNKSFIYSSLKLKNKLKGCVLLLWILCYLIVGKKKILGPFTVSALIRPLIKNLDNSVILHLCEVSRTALYKMC